MPARVLTAYVQNFHARHGTDGALVHRRFYSDLVKSQSHFICALRYRLREIAAATGRAISPIHARTSPKKGV